MWKEEIKFSVGDKINQNGFARNCCRYVKDCISGRQLGGWLRTGVKTGRKLTFEGGEL